MVSNHNFVRLLGKNIDDIQFTGISVHKSGVAYIKCIVRSLDSSEVNHTVMLRWMNETWKHYIIPTVITSHCVIDETERKVLALAADGVVHVASSKGFEWEYIDKSEEGPNSLRLMVDIKQIASSVYAVGMARQVYKRQINGHWIRCDQGARGVRKEWGNYWIQEHRWF